MHNLTHLHQVLGFKITSPLLICGGGLEFLHLPRYKPTRQGAQLPRRGGRAPHHALRAALLQRNLSVVGEASRISVVRPFQVNVPGAVLSAATA
jgi:hypothetical protein